MDETAAGLKERLIMQRNAFVPRDRVFHRAPLLAVRKLERNDRQPVDEQAQVQRALPRVLAKSKPWSNAEPILAEMPVRFSRRRRQSIKQRDVERTERYA